MNSHPLCPACGATNIKKLFYTMQGGFIWTPFLNFMKCRSCGARFQGQTGQLDPQVPKWMRIISVMIIMGFIGLLFGVVATLSSLRARNDHSPVLVPISKVPTPTRRPSPR